MTDAVIENYKKNNLDVLICLGGGGTQKNAYRLMQEGLNVITLPKTIDNDVAVTDISFGFDTALGIATEAIDRLHSTASSHHRIIVAEIMGHNTGWLALGSGIAGGADVILIPEIPYDINKVADAIRQRCHGGKRFSLVAVAEGAMSIQEAKALQNAEQKKKKAEPGAGKKRLLKSLQSWKNKEAIIHYNFQMSLKNFVDLSRELRSWVIFSAGEHHQLLTGSWQQDSEQPAVH